jgi:hypothetical protein
MLRHIFELQLELHNLKYFQGIISTAKYRKLPRNTAKYRKNLPQNTAKYRKIPRNTAKYREIPQKLPQLPQRYYALNISTFQ